MPAAIVGGAGDGLTATTTAVIPARVDGEICAATMIDPDAVAVVTPTVALRAGCSAALVGHLHAAACFDGAVMPPAII